MFAIAVASALIADDYVVFVAGIYWVYQFYPNLFHVSYAEHFVVSTSVVVWVVVALSNFAVGC